MKLNPLVQHIMRIVARFWLPCFAVLIAGVFMVGTAFAQDGTGDARPDLSNLLTLLNYLAGPGAVVLTGLLASRLTESWEWWKVSASRDLKLFLSSIFAVIVSIGALLLGKYLVTLPVETMAEIQIYFQVSFVAVAGVIGLNIFHAVVNKPLSNPS